MKIVQEFKDFALKGNMVDMAVGIIIGGAFGALVKGLVDQIMMPPLGLLVGGMDFSDFQLVLKAAEIGPDGKVIKPAVVLQYGAFITTLINFTIQAFAVFLLVKGINTARTRLEAPREAVPAGPTTEQLLMEIRDLLKRK